MPGNRLSSESSPYLRQHALNPVDWYPWCKEAFDKAVQEQKPIFLSIGYSTCHWCHVMAHESFEDEGIARFLNRHFVSIKVDREERPDIDHIYMTFVTSMTQRGGWPLSVFLTPDAKPFYGGTYFPPQSKWGTPGFLDLLSSIQEAWARDRQGILGSAEDITAALNRSMENKPELLDKDGVLDLAMRHLLVNFDQKNGGFSAAPKFPMPHTLSFLLYCHSRGADAGALGAVQKTLMAMARGGIFDHVGGGFHRYSTDEAWHLPHFEKMLYDQALLVVAYTQAFQITGETIYARVVERTLAYVLRELRSPEGAFYCAQDADSPEMPGETPKEGAFYVWAQHEIDQVLKGLSGPFNKAYGVSEGGNVLSDPHNEFINKNVLYRAQGFEIGKEDLLDECLLKLLEARKTRPAVSRDEKVLTDWNGMMIQAFAYAGSVFGRGEWVEAARTAADHLWEKMRPTDTGLFHCLKDGKAAVSGFLEDYAFFALGLIQLYEAQLDPVHLHRAKQLAEVILTSFADFSGGFYMTQDPPADGQQGIFRPMEVYDGAIPSGNSAAAWVLVKLSMLTGDGKYSGFAKKTFERFLPLAKRSPAAFVSFLGAWDLFQRPPVEISLEGKADETTIALLRKVVYKRFIPALALRRGTEAGPWRVKLCSQGVCKPPVSDAAALDQLLSGS